MRKVNLVATIVIIVLVLTTGIAIAGMRPSAQYVPLHQMLRQAEGKDVGVIPLHGGIEIIEPYQEDSYSNRKDDGSWTYPREIVVKYRVYGIRKGKNPRVHIIVDDKPAIVANGTEVKVTFDRPGWHTIEAILCDHAGHVRRDKTAYDISRVYMGVGHNTVEGQYGRRKTRYYNFDRQPSLLWNITKTEYALANHNDVPLDFYLRHVQLDEKLGPWLKVVIDNEQYTYVKNWESYVFNRLEGGVHDITVQLCDRNGNYIPNATNHITHRITINPQPNYFTPRNAERNAKLTDRAKEKGTPVAPINGGH